MKYKFIDTDFKFWRQLINFWSILFFISIIYDFITNNSLGAILSIISVIYISTLAIYVGDKEFERWYDNHTSKHPGEIFVIIWTVLIVILIILELIFENNYVLPESVISSYIAVLTILAITNKSKELYKVKRQNKQKIYAKKKTNNKKGRKNGRTI